MDLKPKSLFKRVIDFARGERPERARRPRDSVPPEPQADERARETSSTLRAADVEVRDGADDVDGSLDVVGLEVAHRGDGGALVLRWSIGPDDVARAGALVDGQPVLCLRVVSFTKARDDVLREVQDRPGIELRGECEIGEPAQRAIVALGLRAGDRFVSIAHHVI